MNTTLSAQRLVYEVEPLKKHAGENDVEALERLLVQRAEAGWEVVDSCGDELRMPVLIFEKLAQGRPAPEYRVDEIPPVRGHDEIEAVTDKLWIMRDAGWMPCCVLDSLISTPIGIFKKSTRQTGDVLIKVVVVPIDMFERTTTTMVNELLDQQVRDNLTLTCILHGGLSPVLILQSKSDDTPYEYLVEHARGGIFANQTRSLSELIATASEEGWQVCGAFEDSFLFPCVIFRRLTAVVPIAPREVLLAEPLGEPEPGATYRQ